MDGTIIIKKWRAKTGGDYAFITISPFGEVRVNKKRENHSAQDNALYNTGNYYMITEINRIAERVKAIFKNNEEFEREKEKIISNLAKVKG